MEKIIAKWTIEDIKVGSFLINDDDKEKCHRVIGIINDKIIHTINEKGIEFSGQDYYYRNFNYKLLVNESIGKSYSKDDLNMCDMKIKECINILKQLPKEMKISEINQEDLLYAIDSESIPKKGLFNNTVKSDLQFKLEFLKELNITYKQYIESNRLIGSDLIAVTINELIKEISELQK